jgi:hypothetical protein
MYVIDPTSFSLQIFHRNQLLEQLENPDALTPIRYFNLALKETGVRGSG